ncbi:hypothetical protein DSUL_20228 [Desulfovibrionales bacterium]
MSANKKLLSNNLELSRQKMFKLELTVLSQNHCL